MNRKWFAVLGSLAILAALFIFSRPRPRPPLAEPPAPVPADTASAAPAPIATPTVRTEPSTPAYVAVSNPADLPTTRDRTDFYRRGRVLDRRATPPDAEGRWRDSRVIETQGKYPLVRVVETWRHDAATGAPRLESSAATVADHALARLQDGKDVAALEAFLQQVGGRIRRAMPNAPIYLIETPEVSVEALDVLLQKLRGPGSPIAYAEPDRVVHAHFTPDDTAFSSLWGLHNTGQTGGTDDADVDAPEAWEITRGSPAVVVGVIDTGIDYTHRDLAQNIWINTDEIPGNGVDDDGNGYIDDVRGWDFANNDNDPRDDHYHGTHCAGTIGAVGDNAIGVAGVCHTVQLMALKFLTSTGNGFDSDAVEAILYATANGAHLTSNSWGGSGYSQTLKDAIDAAGAAGVLFVAAAGNDAHDNDTLPDYPASFASPNILSVAATDHRDTLASFSNFGANTVHLAAPGVSIYSTIPGGGFGTLSGTSMATPHVAGACALLKAASPSMTGAAIRQAIFAHVDGLAVLSGKVKTGGRLNVARAVIASAGPYLTVTSLEMRDAGLPGAAGNGDGIVNPGEDIAIPIAVQNVGGESASGLTSRLRFVGQVPYIWITRGTHTWGALGANATAHTGATPLTLRVSPQAVTPFTFTLRLTTTDGAGRTWTSDAQCTVLTSATLSGKVTALATGTPIAGATVTCTGTKSLTAITGADGSYTLAVTDGSYTLQASAPGFNASALRETTAPPSRTGLDFALGRARLQVSPASISVTQNEDQITTRALTLRNEGDAPLTIGIATSSALALPAVPPVVDPPLPRRIRALGASTHGTVPASSIGPRAPTPLPFHESFESGVLDGWVTDTGTGTREIVSDTAAVGTRSFRFAHSGPGEHFTGIHRDFAAGARPRYVSFWVRSGATDTADGYFVLTDDGTDAIWFYADEYGKFYVNADVGGDDTVSYQPRVWYRIEFRDIDWTGKHFDYFVDGVLVKANIPFRYPGAITEFDQAWLYNFHTNSEAWWDDIRVSDSATDWLRFTPSNLTLAPGQSATVAVTLDSTDLDGGTYRASLDLYTNDPANPVTSVPVALTVVLSPNTPPVANSQTVTLAEDTTASIVLDGTDADGHALTATVTQLPVRGTLYQTADGTTPGAAIATVPALITDAQRRVLYTPPLDANGTAFATFQFILKDKRSQSNTATVTLHVTPVNDPPIARDDTASGLPGQTLASIAVLANDSDADGDPLTITGFTQGARGTVSNNGNGTLRYAPGTGFTTGTDAFTYIVSDGRGASATASVAVSLGYLRAGPWPQFGRNEAHTGYYPAALAGQPLALNWEIATDSYHRSNHLPIADGKVFVTRAFSGGIYDPAPTTAIDLATGIEVWRAATPEGRTYSGASYHAGRIYFQRNQSGGSSNFWCLDASTGATIYTTLTRGQGMHFLPPTVTDSTVFMAGGEYGGLHGFNRATGQQLFLFDVNFAEEWTPTVGAGAVFSCVDGVLISHHPATGVKNWEHALDAGFQYLYEAATPVFENGRVYLAGQTGLYCIAVTGAAAPTRVWRATGNFKGIPAVAAGRVYAIARATGAVQSYDAATGAALGTYATSDSEVGSQPIVTSDALLVSAENSVFIFDLATRALLQTLPVGGRMSLADGALVLCDAGGMVRSYSVAGAANRAPVATPVSVIGAEGTPLAVTLTGTDADGDPLTALIVSLPTVGALFQTPDGVQLGAPILTVPARVLHPQRKVIFRPAPDGAGPAYATFGFKVNDGAINSAAATATINLTGENDPPVAVPDTIYVLPGSSVDFLPTANDSDPDGEIPQLVSFTQPARGTVTRTLEMLRYTPQAGFADGTDTFTYTIRDGAGLTASATVTAIVGVVGREWPTFGGAPDHPGRYDDALGTTPFVELWQYPAGITVNPLAVAEGRVFYTERGYFSGLMYAVALDARTGAEVWRSTFQPGYSLGPPTYYGGSLFLHRCNHSTDTQVWAVRADSGAVKWSAALSAQWERYMAPAVSEFGAFFAGGYERGLHGYDRETGASKFHLNFTEWADEWTPSISGGGLYSFVSGKFRSHNPATGAVLWTVDLPWAFSTYSMYRTVAFDLGRAFLINDADTYSNRELVCIDLATRSVAWRASGVFTGTPAILGGVVHALSGGMVRTFGASSGQPLGDYTAPNESYLSGAPVVAADVLIAASSSKTYFFNRATRQLIQTLDFGSEPAAVADGVVHLACSDGTVRAYGHIPAGNRAPIATAAQHSIAEEAQFVVTLAGTDADNDPLSIAIRTLPAQGTLYQTADGATKGAAITRVPAHVSHAGGRVIYQAPLDVFGSSAGSFTFTAHDRYAASAPATVRIDILPVNDPPLAIPDTIAVRPGQVLRSFHPEANDRDPDGDVLTIIAFTQGASGQVSQNADGSLDYTPNAGFTGSDTFQYTTRDAGGVISSASVTVLVSATVGREWPTFGNGPEHTGFQPVALGSTPFALRWANNLGKPPHKVAVVGGRAFTSEQVYHTDAAVVALDAPTGGEAWRVIYTGVARMNPPSAFGSDVFFQVGNSSNSRLHALRAADGTSRWSSPFGAQFEEYMAPAIDATGVFVNGGYYGGLYGFNVASGAQLFFNSALEQFDDWTPTLHNGGLYSFVTGKFRSHLRTTGAIQWTLDFGWDWHGYDMDRTTACAGNRAYLVNDSVTVPAGDQELIAIDLVTRAAAWKVRGKFTGTPAVAHQAVFALSGGNSVRAYDAGTGQFLGAYIATDETALWWQPIVTHDTLIAYSATKTYLFDLRTRALRQTLPFGGHASLAGETLYLASNDNHVRAYGIPDSFNLPPTAQPLTITTPEDTQVAVTLQGSDPENASLTFVISRLPTTGALYRTTDGTTRGTLISTVPALITSSPARVIYLPPQDRHGAGLGNFGYAVSDGSSLSTEGAVTLNVTPVNDPPVAVADVRQTQPGQILSPLRETLNDFDVDGDALTVVAFTQPPAGSVVQNADGTLRYHPPLHATSGTETFTYTIEDAAGARATGQVSVSIVAAIEGFWPTFGNGPDHTGYTSAPLGRGGWVQRWSYTGTTGTAQQVAIAEGKVFVSHEGYFSPVPRVTALAEKTGQQLWQRTFASSYSMNPPTYYGGRVFVQRGNHGTDTQLIALTAADGSTAWSSPHGAQWENYFAPAVSDFGVYVNGGSYGGMYGFNRTTGAQLFFNQSFAQYDGWTPSLHAGGLYSFVAGYFSNHSPTTGAANWSVSLGWDWHGWTMDRTVAFESGRAFLVNNAVGGNELVCIDLTARAVLWRVAATFQGTPAVHNGTVFASNYNSVQARSALDGRLLATFTPPTGEYLYTQPLVTDELVLALSSAKTFIWGRYDQVLVQTLPRGGFMSAADDQLIVASSDGVVAAYAGQPAVTFAPPGGTFSQPLDVTLTAATAGARIYYTADGSAPQLTSPSVLSGGTVRVAATGKLRAISVLGSAFSRIHEAAFTLTSLDGDALPDWWETAHWGTLTATDGTRDSDSDGANDLAEFAAGTDPRDGRDVLAVCHCERIAAGLELAWPSKADRLYVIESSHDCATWTAASAPIAGDGTVLTVVQPITHTDRGFFRVRALPK